MTDKPKRLISDNLPPPANEQEKYDAKRLIQIGSLTKDELTKKIGQARLRIQEGRATLDDYELLGIKQP